MLFHPLFKIIRLANIKRILIRSQNINKKHNQSLEVYERLASLSPKERKNAENIAPLGKRVQSWCLVEKMYW
jgi:hypothetical protein